MAAALNYKEISVLFDKQKTVGSKEVSSFAHSVIIVSVICFNDKLFCRIRLCLY